MSIGWLEVLLVVFSDFVETPAFLLHENARVDSLEELVNWSFTAEKWIFNRSEWSITCPILEKKAGFPLTAAGIHRLYREMDAAMALPILNLRWKFVKAGQARKKILKKAMRAALENSTDIPLKYRIQISAKLRE
ncbi:hypothetical protein R1flu_019048 [Riccia fluitans]|uniref:Uncharacterized protein n=1 Tax=Riccia fluitans TaxID=41844 RepID=A0ABD1ZHX1_9MARC